VTRPDGTTCGEGDECSAAATCAQGSCVPGVRRCELTLAPAIAGRGRGRVGVTCAAIGDAGGRRGGRCRVRGRAADGRWVTSAAVAPLDRASGRATVVVRVKPRGQRLLAAGQPIEIVIDLVDRLGRRTTATRVLAGR